MGLLRAEVAINDRSVGCMYGIVTLIMLSDFLFCTYSLVYFRSEKQQCYFVYAIKSILSCPSTAELRSKESNSTVPVPSDQGNSHHRSSSIHAAF